ncbi:ORC-CDC6 family AAA ATPase [Marinobacter shengliensis]|uniref:ORC-CDC6 family AAA ATPase n=1 Tax=Marinobacter shengliensis TaxID=1389223 RepID=UPI001107E69D|nr:hypothetical protein [Marinobacter shengliensis]
MNRFDNPFHDLWITEILDSDRFVEMFSPYVAQHSEEIFNTGNVVVKGRQGSGKSMLLGLLGTKTRVAYARANVRYPAPEKQQSFITAEINLTRDNARIVASRLSEIPESKRKDWAATTFADYVNYVLTLDLLKNVIFLSKEQRIDKVLSKEIPITISPKTEENFIDLVKKSDFSYGFFKNCNSIDDIIERINCRLRSYRRFFNFNVDQLDQEVESTKTDIGEPIAVIAEYLRESGILPNKTLVFLRIDQHEELYELERSTKNSSIFRQVINRALAMRDKRVSYRIGTRHYAWAEDVTVWGSGAHLENMRDFTIVDIDEILKRSENREKGNLIFDNFAEDVFRRRLTSCNFNLYELDIKTNAISHVFGKTLKPAERAQKYAKGHRFKLSPDPSWTPEWRSRIAELWRESPLEAKFTDAWLRQKTQKHARVSLDPYAKTTEEGWRNRKYWIKERNEAALIQIAGVCNESLIWCGSRHILDLSGWNILAFMSICRAIWAAWLRKVTDEELENTQIPSIGVITQSVGIYEASKIWSEKLKEGTDGDRRSRFINNLGSWFSAKIRNDIALSNPGHNGISLLTSEIDENRPIVSIIKSCRDNGDLMESSHTTKSKDSKPRIKWYLNPLLCPYFRIPHIRTKEPIYTNLIELELVFNGNSPGVKDTGNTDQSFQEELF